MHPCLFACTCAAGSVLHCKKNGAVLNYFKFTQTGYELAKLIRLAPEQSYLTELHQIVLPSFEVEF